MECFCINRICRIFALALLSIGNLIAQSTPEKIAQVVNEFGKLGQFEGAVLVAENNRIIYKGGVGYANREWEIPNTSKTKFMLGSVSKQFTAMLILQLVNKGLISLDDSVSDHLPSYPKAQGKKIKIRHLLNHTSGIPDVMNFADFDELYAHRRFKTQELLGLFNRLPLEFEPGSDFRYSNSGYNVLAAIIEEITGQDYGMVLRNFILDPLGMNHTGFASSNEVIKKLAEGYLWAPIEGRIHASYFDNSISKGSGGVYSTVEDLFIWDQALYTNELLSENLRDQMMTPNKNGYGYGFWIYEWTNPSTSEALKFVEHGGANAGFNTLILRVPENRQVIILLSNLNISTLNFLKYRIRSILYDQPYSLPELELRDIAADLVREGGVGALRKEYGALKQKYIDEYGDREFMFSFSQLGYGLLLSGHTQQAIEIYELNAETFPNFAKVFDDLGEIYMLEGNREKAILYLKKSLELAPNNSRTLHMYKKLLD